MKKRGRQIQIYYNSRHCVVFTGWGQRKWDKNSHCEYGWSCEVIGSSTNL